MTTTYILCFYATIYSSEPATIWYVDYVGSPEPSSYGTGSTPGQGQEFGISPGRMWTMLRNLG